MEESKLSVGKLRGLQQLGNARGIFTLLALDHRRSLRRALNPAAPQAVPNEALVQLKLRLTRVLAPHASGILLDPLYGAAQAIGQGALPGDVGLIVSLEQAGYEGSETARRTALIPNWDAGKARRMGASAAKLRLHYRPDAATARQQEDLVAEVGESCRIHDIPLLLEPVSYSLDPTAPKGSATFARQRPLIVYDSARWLVPLGVDLLAAEFPVNLQYESPEQALSHCLRLSDALAIPWVLLSGAVDYDLFRRQVEIACRGGASGFLAGRVVWQEVTRLRHEEWDDFASTVALERLQTLVAIANAEARPYRPIVEIPGDWLQTYGREAIPAAPALTD